jgi:hypothetical protein
MVLPVVELSMVRMMAITSPHRMQLRIGSAPRICNGGADFSSSLFTLLLQRSKNEEFKSSIDAGWHSPNPEGPGLHKRPVIRDGRQV